MIKFKPSVKVSKQTIIASAVANVAEIHNRTVWVTSGNDSTHMKGSKHYTDEALDIRSKDFPDPAEKKQFLLQVLSRLGPAYQGILEDENGSNEHFHIEYDPKPTP